MKFTFKNIVIYLTGLALLGFIVTLVMKQNLGMDAWDAFYYNLHLGLPMAYKYLNPIIALILLPIAYLIQKKKFDLWFFFPLVISAYVGVWIDWFEVLIPDVSEASIFWNIGYLLTAIVVCAIGLNMVTYCQYPLPPLDLLCDGIGKLMHSTYGRGKLVGEMIALVLTVISGIIFGFYEEWFNIGIATIVFGFAIGPVIDWMRKPLYRILEGKKR